MRDLSGMNLTSWASLIQDVAQGMKVVPPNLSMEVCLDSMVLLQLLEVTTGMGYCRICCQPSPQCCCIDDYQLAPTETWSQMMARMPGQGVAASIGGPTTPSTAPAEVQEQGVPPPPPGLHPPNFTNWSLSLPEAPVTGGLLTPSGGLPGIGKQTVGPWVLGQWALHSPGNAASSSAKATPACYPLQAGGAATEPACYSIPAGCAATQEASREGIVSLTSLRQSHSCSQSNHPQPQKATGQGMGHQRQISGSPQMRPRDDNQCSLNYHPGRHAIPNRPSFPAQTP